MDKINKTQVKSYLKSLEETNKRIKQIRASNPIISFEGMSLEEKVSIIEQNKLKKALVKTKDNKYKKGIIEPKDNIAFGLNTVRKELEFPPNWYLPIFYRDLSELVIYND